MTSDESKTCVEKPEEKGNEEHENKQVMISIALLLGITIVISFILDFFFHGVPLGFTTTILNVTVSPALSEVLYYVIVLIAAAYIGITGLRELVVEKRFSVEFLMAVAALGALYLHALFEAATVLFLYSIAEYFEGYIEDRARRTVEKLSKFMPDKARIIQNGAEKIVKVNEVEPNMALLVRAGERIPLDGNVVEGFSHVDQAVVTGESVPVSKNVNDCVYAGTLNLSGPLKIEVTKKASETLVSRIMVLVSQSGKRKASIERLVDRFAKIYVPIVIALAAVTAIVPTLIFGGSVFNIWLYRSLILLVVSCPSAFIISVPATVFVAITIAARRGVIIKGGVYVEKLAKVKRVVFDKTGTLTLGRPDVHEVRLVQRTEDEALAMAAALDQFSNHPVAQAIVRRAREKGIDLSKMKVTDVMEIAGKGIIGNVNGNFVAVGNLELMKQFNCNCTEAFAVDQADTHTSVCVSVGKEGLATVCVVDQVREDALKAIDDLKKSGIKTAMLTGDRAQIAKETGHKLKIDEVYAELFPEDKLKCIEDMKRKDGLVAMVGDGVNDAPALANSDVGIAMGAAGVDVALESADVVLVKDELAQIPYLIKLSEKTMTIAKQNIAASLVIKLILGALGVIGVTGLLATVVAGDDGVTMLLLLNSLRLERIK
jgi:Cd2+/Zn2+-exporting ATPase